MANYSGPGHGNLIRALQAMLCKCMYCSPHPSILVSGSFAGWSSVGERNLHLSHITGIWSPVILT